MKNLFTIFKIDDGIFGNKVFPLIAIAFLHLFIFAGGISVKAQNIFSGEGVNWVGAPESYSEPTNLATGDYRVLSYRKVSTTTSLPTDGRGQWVTTINVQSSGGNITPDNMAGGSGAGFLFTSGPSGNQFQNKWNFANVGQGALNAVNGVQFTNSGSGQDMGLNMGTAGYYTFVLKDAGYATSGFYVGYTTGKPVTISHNVSNNTYSSSTSATINFTVGGTPSSQENFYVRYLASSNNFDVSGTTLVQAAVTGTVGTATITGLTAGTTYDYYIFSSTRSLASLQASAFADIAYECLNYADNSGNDYSFTAGAAPVITSASPGGTYGTAFSFNISATNAPSSYAIASGTLPAGLSLNTSTGAITGTPTTAITSSVVGISATNISGTGTGALTFTIGKASLTISANASQSKIYGTNDPTFTYSQTGLAVGDNISGSLGRASGENVGAYAYNLGSVAVTNAVNYIVSLSAGNFTVTPASLTIDPSDGQNKIYGINDPSVGFTYKSTGLINGVTPQYWNSSGNLVNDVTINDAISGNLGRTSGENVGTYTYNLGSVAASIPGNYTMSLTANTFTITPASLTINPTKGQNKVYGTADPIFAYTSSGLINGITPLYWNDLGVFVNAVTIADILNGNLGRVSGENVGAYAYNLGNLAVSIPSDYIINLSGGIFTITAGSSTITVTGGTVYTYNNTPQGPASVSETGSTGGVTYSYAGTNSTSYGPSGTAPTNAGTYAVTATVAGDANYNGATSAPYGFAINGAPLTITANNITKCNGATYVFTGTEFTTSGLINGDGSSVTNVSLASAGAASGAAAGNYDIIPSAVVTGTGLSNYAISYVNGTLTVETPVSVTMIQTNPDCHGNPGSLTSTVSGGISPYSYKVNTGLNYNPSGSFVSTPLFSGLTAGYYAYGVKDANGCLTTAPGLTLAPLTQEPVLINNVAAPSTVQVCYGGSTTIETTVFGGNGPYTYYLNGTGTGVGAANRYFNVGAGSYFIKVTDANGCSYNTNTISVTQPSTALSLSAAVNNLSCVSTTGSITITAAGGYSSSYTYSDDGGSTFHSGSSFTGLAAGLYNLAVKDANGCTATGTANVLQNTLTSSAITGNTEACFGSSVTISTTPSGGTPPYTYSLDGGAYVTNANKYFTVGAGIHYITVMDNAGCTYTTPSVTVTQASAAVSFTSAVTNASCSSATGSVTVTAAGGYGGYSYSDDNGVSFHAGSSFTGLGAGTYNLVVKDINGCTAAGTATVKAPTFTASAITGSTQVCFGAMTAISTTGSGGVSPYTYSVDATNNFVPSANRYFSVGAGVHTITVMDNAGCTATASSITITQPSAGVTYSAVQGGSGCTGNAGIAVTAAGGYGGYSYSDNGGSSYQAGAVFTGLSYGNYTIAVKDQNGCAASQSVVKLTALTSSAIAGTLTVCPGGSTTINTVPSGGSSPYTYSLDNGAFVPSSGRYFNVTAGIHSITVKDNAGCTYAPPSVTVTTVSCPGPNNNNGGDNGKTVITSASSFEAKVSPNPSQGAFHVSMKSSSREDVEMIVTDMAGRKMYETKGTIDQVYEFGAQFTSGMYILQIRQGNALHTVKLVRGN